MAEKAVRVADGSSGNYIAMRDAVELDGSGNARVIERMDFASGKCTSPIGNATRGNSSMIAAAESLDLTSLPSDLTSNLITVGDKSMLCVAVDQSAAVGSITITPIVYDGAGTIVGVLQSKTFLPAYAFRRGSGSGNYPLPVQTWDVVGAYQIGLHVSAVSSANTCKVWGWVI